MAGETNGRDGYVRTSQTCPQSGHETLILLDVMGLAMVRGERHFGQGQRMTCAAIGGTTSGPPSRADSLMRLLPGGRNVRKASSAYSMGLGETRQLPRVTR